MEQECQECAGRCLSLGLYPRVCTTLRIVDIRIVGGETAHVPETGISHLSVPEKDTGGERRSYNLPSKQA